MKKCINGYFYPAEDDVDDCYSISDILRELEINEDGYYTDLEISKDNDYELRLVSSTTILKMVC